MSPNDSNKIKKKNVASESLWKSDDFRLSMSVLCGIVLVSALCYLTPVKSFTIEPLAALMETSKETKEKLPAKKTNFWTGVYSLGRVMMSLARKDEFVDSEIDIEYNGQLLTISTSGEVEDEKTAKNFFKKKEAKLKDAIVMQSSEVTGDDVIKTEGVNQFKSQIVTSLNRYFDDESIVTNIYFKKFVLFSEKIED